MYATIIRNGLWSQNPGLVQLLGLCPLLAVSNTLVNGIGLAVATLFVICATNVLVSMTRSLIRPQVRLPIFVLTIASLVTVTDLVMQARYYELYLNLGIFIPLITTNCLILGRAESFASRNPVLPSLVDGLSHGLGFAAVLVLLGTIRELTGYGTVGRGFALLVSGGATPAMTDMNGNEAGVLVMLLPAGAFFALGMLVALRNAWTGRRQREPAAHGATRPQEGYARAR